MNNSQEDIIRKIQSLLALADVTRGASDAEAAAAMMKATELMTKNGIEHAQLSAADPSLDPFAIGHEEVVTVRPEAEDYDVNIAHILIDCFGVRVLFSRTRCVGQIFHTYVFVGDQMDIALAKYALPILVAAMTGHSFLGSASARSYYLGVERGYITASDQGRRKATSQADKAALSRYAIVCARKEEDISKYVTDKFGHPPVIAPERELDDPEAYFAGFQNGAQLDLDGTGLILPPPR